MALSQYDEIGKVAEISDPYDINQNKVKKIWPGEKLFNRSRNTHDTNLQWADKYGEITVTYTF